MFACFIEGSGHVDRKYWQRLWSAKSVLTIRKSKAKSARQLTVWVSGSATVIERHWKNRKKSPRYLRRPLAPCYQSLTTKKRSAGNATTDDKPRTTGRIQLYMKTTARKLYVNQMSVRPCRFKVHGVIGCTATQQPYPCQKCHARCQSPWHAGYADVLRGQTCRTCRCCICSI